MKWSVTLTDRLGPEILTVLEIKGQVLHRVRLHVKVPGWLLSLNALLTKALFIWRKIVPGKRVTLLAESTLPRVYMRKMLTPLPEPRANFPMTTELAHALIVSP